MDDIQMIADFLWSQLSTIFDLYMSSWLLTGFISVWLIRKILKIFSKI